MSDLFDNPMGLCGFEFVEFASPKPGVLEPMFEKMGFTLVAKHRSKNVLLYRQGGINFIVNNEPGNAAYFAGEHGASACGLAFRVRDAHKAYNRALELGAQPIEIPTGPMELRLPAIKGIGGAPLYLIDRFEDGKSIYDIDFEFLPGVDLHPKGHGFQVVDHLTHNVYRGRMAYWADFYTRLFNFREIRYFDIKGLKTGLVSKAMTAPDGIVRIPLNESSDPKSQINEYLDAYKGEGIQHIACFTENIYDTVEAMRAQGVEFLDTPDTYFDVIDMRVPNHGEDVARLAKNKILIDADPETKQRKLLQIFTTNCIGPIFFEIIQRKGNEGFGEGNFTALFESIERDQMKRGVL
jgi:4-hydroxyphenylpyruvate dioxygenase